MNSIFEKKEFLDVRTFCNNVYIEFVNDYITIEKMAEDKGFPIKMMTNIIEIGRYVHNGFHPEK